jgi:hypothetical protein
MSAVGSCVALGSHWDRMDHVAAATRMRAIADVVNSCTDPKAIEHDPNQKRSSGTLPPMRSSVLWRRSILHQNGTRASVVANIVATSCGHRSRIEFEMRGHPDIKDMAAHIHLPITMHADVDCAAVAEVAAAVLERSIDRKQERVDAYRSLSETADALSIVCRDRWAVEGRSLFQTVETFCATPWSRADALLHRDSEKSVMLFAGGRDVVASRLPTAMTADWVDDTIQGTGERRILLTLRPYSTLSIVSGHAQPDAMAALRANALLPLAENQLCRLA